MTALEELDSFKRANPDADHRGAEDLMARFWAREIDKHEVTFRFGSAEKKAEFLGQMTDGAGEEYFRLHWDWEHGVHLDDAKVIDAEYTDPWADAYDDGDFGGDQVDPDFYDEEVP